MGVVRIFYDFEFLDLGRTIEPISLGMVRDDGHEYYAVFAGIMSPPVYRQICRHDWLMRNVIPHLPLTPGTTHKPPTIRYGGQFQLDRQHAHVKSRTMIKHEVKNFLDAAQPVQLWGYYAAYDHICLAQLFGPMMDRHPSMPMVTFDIVQLCHHLGRSEAGLPKPPERAHNALADARWTRDAWEALQRPAEGS